LRKAEGRLLYVSVLGSRRQEENASRTSVRQNKRETGFFMCFGFYEGKIVPVAFAWQPKLMVYLNRLRGISAKQAILQ
jgi:hypothetical protein